MPGFPVEPAFDQGIGGGVACGERVSHPVVKSFAEFPANGGQILREQRGRPGFRFVPKVVSPGVFLPPIPFRKPCPKTGSVWLTQFKPLAVAS